MRLLKLNNRIDQEKLLAKVEPTKAGLIIMKDKAKSFLIFIEDLRTPAANILKQDALSIGADLAVPKNTILCQDKTVDAILIATKKQIKILIKKERMQPFGLKEFSKELEVFLNEQSFETKIMGVINANDDSFFEGSRFKGQEAVSQIESMIKDGANIIDIGGVSSRPGSEAVSEKEEFERIQPIIDAVYEQKLYDKAVFSLDSYNPKCLDYALSRGFKIVNDITGLENDEVAKVVSTYYASVVIMHMQGTPQEMQKNPAYHNVIFDIEQFFHKRIQKAKSFGIEEIVLDVGIGFGKTLEHNLILLKHLEHFKKFSYELLIGTSRKSMIDMISPSKPQERLPGTLTLHLEAVRNGASIIRCHDVKEHNQALKAQEALDKTLL